MNEKHNLDRLFQEKFKDFEVAPPEFVWENIREELQEKKKRRVIPLWLRLSGVAALLVLGGLMATLFFNDDQNPATNAPAVVIDNTAATPADAIKTAPIATPSQAGPSAEESTMSTNNNTSNNNTSNNTTGVAAAQGNTNNNGNNATPQNNTNKRSGNNTILSSGGSTNTAVAQESTTTSINKKNGKRTNRNTAIRQGDTVAANQTASKDNSNNNTVNNNNAQRNKAQGTGIVSTESEGLATTDTKSSIKNTDSNTANINTAQQKQNVPNGTADNMGVAATDNGSGTNNPVNTQNDPALKNNVIIDKNIPATEIVAETVVDTTTVVPENELEKLLQEKLKGENKEKELAKNEKSKDRWNIRPQVAPVFYSSLSNGSPINEQFASNSKSYDNDLSYGLGINYAVSDRISIRSGINTVNLNYSTNDIAYYASLNNLTTNIGQSKTANIVVTNPGAATPDTFLIDGQTTQLMEGSMMQKTGYIEIPLEMSYAIINKKFGVDLIGGVSSLFLNENNVSVISSSGASTQVGQAQNLNNLHFSTNLGVGFKYRFWDSFQASFEPTFKYQVNAYSRDAGNFKPYFIGLYSGISFSF